MSFDILGPMVTGETPLGKHKGASEAVRPGFAGNGRGAVDVGRRPGDIRRSRPLFGGCLARSRLRAELLPHRQRVAVSWAISALAYRLDRKLLPIRPVQHTPYLSFAHSNSLTARGYIGARRAGHEECRLPNTKDLGYGACLVSPICLLICPPRGAPSPYVASWAGGFLVRPAYDTHERTQLHVESAPPSQCWYFIKLRWPR
jgi:hypothetical protein